MHFRKLVMTCGFAAAFLANYVNALGLGEVELRSALNQPLDAEIKLLDVGDLSAEQIIVALGSPADFERNGLERLHFYTEIKFNVVLNSSEGAIVQLSTRNPVREPYLNFLVEARWTSGRLLREYTLLMDLPTFADEPAAPVASPSYSQPAPKPRADAPTRTPSSSSNRSDLSSSQGSDLSRESTSNARIGSYGPVDGNDTLWQIALNARPDRSLSVHQTMLAIQRLNPDAFINGNINLLRKGQVLRLPSADEIRSLSRSEAVREVALQNDEWADNSSMGAQLNASKRDNAPRRETETVNGRVKLIASESNGAGSGQGSGDGVGGGQALQAELTSTLEELDRTRSENNELTSRVRDLEEQITTMERLVEVSNEQLRMMQLAAEQTDNTTNAVESDTSAELNTSAADVTGESSELVTEPQTEEIKPAAEEAKVEAPAVRNTTKIIPLAAKPKTLVDHLLDNILWIGIGLIVLLIAIYALVRRRNADNENNDALYQEEDLFAVQPEENQDAYIDEQDLDGTADAADEEMPLFDEDNVPAEAETEDVVGEADIYIAYGKFDQAEEMLLNGLTKEPQSVDIRMKLLEIYTQTEDVTKFDECYAGLLGLANHAELQRAAELRESIPGAGEFNLAVETDDPNALQEVTDAVSDDDLILEDAPEDDEFTFDLDDEFPSTLETDELLASGSELGKSDTRYDLSFEEEPGAAEETFTLELDDTLETDVDLTSSTASDDTDELSFDLGDEVVVAPVVEPSADREPSADKEPSADIELSAVDAPATPIESVSEEEEFNFDFDAEEVTDEEVDVSLGAVTDNELVEQKADNADDFDPDMEMGALDLSALDQELDSFDQEMEEMEQQMDEVKNEEVLAIDDGDLADFELDLDLEEQEPETQNIASTDAEDELFEQALSEVPASGSEEPSSLSDQEPSSLSDQEPSSLSSEESSSLEDLSDDDLDAELDFLADTDEAATKLDLARAYIDMGDADGARDILAEVAQEGNEQQRKEASELLERIV